ncbi:MAG: RDD family protein [Candidatus Izemoplasmatales bacterium]|jgi:hypothetical protein|nr:RDD family protein [Candidatus Izemoplasmatales bacterium]MDY0373770.1 RDD family protein [Candidatus Izemoplasmatales bacterium]NLF48098.1 hypothetical protein [Acholeplasmataceae bacterium]
MNAGFFKRSFSTLIDLLIVFVIVYLTFILFGRSVLRNQIPDFDRVNDFYQEVLEVYNQDLEVLSEEYSAAITLAAGDKEKEAEAQLLYQIKTDIIRNQNTIDIEPFNRPLTRYFMLNISYYAIGFLILMTIYTLALKGRTVGRIVMGLELKGSVHIVSVFFHDIVFKYFLIVLLLVVNLNLGIIVFFLQILLDMIMLSISRKKATLRDIILKITVEKKGYSHKSTI